MGFLSKGKPLHWSDAQKYLAYVKQHGVTQFLQLYQAAKDRNTETFLWGDEIESILVVLDPKTNTVRLSLRGAEVLETIGKVIEQITKSDPSTPFNASFLPEYGCFMVEATPGKPYGGMTGDLVMVEHNMRLRRSMVASLLQPNERMFTIGTFPLMGVGQFTSPALPIRGDAADSDYITDGIISPHPRFSTLTRNIRLRRGTNVDIRIPLFQDENTKQRFAKTPLHNIEEVPSDAKEETKTDSSVKVSNSFAPEKLLETPLSVDKEIHMDAMGFGMGCCCLQVTFQARHIREARHLYDHLAVFSPIMLALTASTPFFNGRISDNDVRWTVISQSVDDRTAEERGLKPITQGKMASAATPARRINKSRYDSIDSFLSLENNFKSKYNDLDLIYDEPTYKKLADHGVDELLAKHISHLFIRDPLVIYEEHIEIDDKSHADHFENIQSTNWQTVRFKPPPPNSPIGWRVEFRTMEIQISDFENAAFTVFIALLSRAILFFDLNFYIPISKVDENLKRAHSNDAARKEKFFFRKTIQPCAIPNCDLNFSNDDDGYEEMTMEQIICGKSHVFPGMIPIVKSYLDIIKCEAGSETRRIVDSYLELIAKRAKGELLTCAQWMRTFVTSHPSYKHDSVLPQDVVYDLLVTIDEIVNGVIQAPQLLGDTVLTPPSRVTIDKDNTVHATTSSGSAPMFASHSQLPAHFALDFKSNPCGVMRDLVIKHLHS